MSKTYNPVSTYRLQFNNQFGFQDALKIVPYLEKTGVRTVYASPVFKAVPGSDHGYDVIVPDQLNDEIGTEQEFDALIKALRKSGIGWIQDIVPNHMAFSSKNPWIFDLLQKGSHSRYFKYFDLEMSEAKQAGEGNFRLMLPFLGGSLQEVIEKNELKLSFRPKGLMVNYYESEYPVSSESYYWLLNEVQEIQDAFTTTIAPLLEQTEDDTKRRIREINLLYNDNSDFRDYFSKCLKSVNNDAGLMEKLISMQHYEPVHWQETEQRINFRRFFTINGLICINILNPVVFADHHRLILKWIEEGVIQGVRVDHIDGLYDPLNYLEKLRDLGEEQLYISIEKILEEGERIPENWPVQGTTGYDFLGLVNNLLTNETSEVLFYDFLTEWTDLETDFEKIALEKKKFFLKNRFSGDLSNLVNRFRKMNLKSFASIKDENLRAAISGFLVHCPVYRIYGVPSDFHFKDMQIVEQIFEDALKEAGREREALLLLRELLLSSGNKNSDTPNQIDDFFRRCMQFTGPLMAKGIEDTLFYSYAPFLAHNEVGDSPGYFGIRKEKFHQEMIYRQHRWPLAMNTTATHDTKRGADARARLNVLSNIPEKWMESTRSWRKMNNKFKMQTDEGEIPSKNDEYFIYQSLCAHLPMDGSMEATFRERFTTFLIKALREAKLFTSWSDPNEEYEKQALAFIEKILDPSHTFSASLKSFVSQIRKFGAINSLTQLILRNTVPGFPDNFQGSERWNLDFVDPDNRKPVNYDQLMDDLTLMIDEGQQDPKKLIKKLWDEHGDGKIKQWVNYLITKVRNERPELFSEGEYIPLSEEGDQKSHVLAYQRKYKEDVLMVVVPLNLAATKEPEKWGDTRFVMDDDSPARWTDILTGESRDFLSMVPVSEVFSDLPFAVLLSKNGLLN